MKEEFLEIGLHVVALPLEFKEGKVYHRLILKELPHLTGEGFSQQEAYSQLTEAYLMYREHFLKEEVEEVETTENLTLDQLLKYYDGENFDGFKIN